MRIRPLQFATIPDWCINKECQDATSFAAAITLADLESESFRLNADTQHKLFGFVLFGKKNIVIDPDWPGVRVWKKVAFGHDYNDQHITWAELDRIIKAKWKISI